MTEIVTSGEKLLRVLPKRSGELYMHILLRISEIPVTANILSEEFGSEQTGNLSSNILDIE